MSIEIILNNENYTSMIQSAGTFFLAAWPVYVFYKQNKINRESERLKSELKSQVDVFTEQVKFNHNKNLQDFKLWSEKKHEAYAKTYDGLAGLLDMLYFRGEKEDLLINYLEMSEVDGVIDKEKLKNHLNISKWNKNLIERIVMNEGICSGILRKSMLKALLEVEILDIVSAQMGEMANELNRSSIYISKEARDLVEKIFFDLSADATSEGNEVYKDSVVLNMEIFRNMIREELSGEKGN